MKLQAPAHSPEDYQNAIDRALVKQSRILIERIQQALHETIIERHERKMQEKEQEHKK